MRSSDLVFTQYALYTLQAPNRVRTQNHGFFSLNCFADRGAFTYNRKAQRPTVYFR